MPVLEGLFEGRNVDQGPASDIDQRGDLLMSARAR